MYCRITIIEKNTLHFNKLVQSYVNYTKEYIYSSIRSAFLKSEIGVRMRYFVTFKEKMF